MYNTVTVVTKEICLNGGRNFVNIFKQIISAPAPDLKIILAPYTDSGSVTLAGCGSIQLVHVICGKKESS